MLGKREANCFCAFASVRRGGYGCGSEEVGTGRVKGTQRDATICGSIWAIFMGRGLRCGRESEKLEGGNVNERGGKTAGLNATTSYRIKYLKGQICFCVRNAQSSALGRVWGSRFLV